MIPLEKRIALLEDPRPSGPDKDPGRSCSGRQMRKRFRRVPRHQPAERVAAPDASSDPRRHRLFRRRQAQMLLPERTAHSRSARTAEETLRRGHSGTRMLSDNEKGNVSRRKKTLIEKVRRGAVVMKRFLTVLFVILVSSVAHARQNVQEAVPDEVVTEAAEGGYKLITLEELERQYLPEPRISSGPAGRFPRWHSPQFHPLRLSAHPDHRFLFRREKRDRLPPGLYPASRHPLYPRTLRNEFSSWRFSRSYRSRSWVLCSRIPPFSFSLRLSCCLWRSFFFGFWELRLPGALNAVLSRLCAVLVLSGDAEEIQ